MKLVSLRSNCSWKSLFSATGRSSFPLPCQHKLLGHVSDRIRFQKTLYIPLLGCINLQRACCDGISQRRAHFSSENGVRATQASLSEAAVSLREGNAEKEKDEGFSDLKWNLDSYGAAQFEGTVPDGCGKLRLDAYLASKMPQASRSKVQASVREGRVSINGKDEVRVSRLLKEGDFVRCSLGPPPLTEAIPEDIPIEIVYEDEHLLVVNKPAHMVVHPAPGNLTGTLVNAILHHCHLPPVLLPTPPTSTSDDSGGEEEEVGGGVFKGPQPSIRPGIVHRLDKGTTGLLVVAKDERSNMELCQQFKDRTVSRSYLSIVCGVPEPATARVEAPIGRDPKDRKRMAVRFADGSSDGGRYAASKYRVRERLANGGATLVEWRLETGRTHQIRVHAKHMGHPLLGDDTYGGTDGTALARLLRGLPAQQQGRARQLFAGLDRPCLHAQTLGFIHPWTGKELRFSANLPEDLEKTLRILRELSL